MPMIACRRFRVCDITQLKETIKPFLHASCTNLLFALRVWFMQNLR